MKNKMSNQLMERMKTKKNLSWMLLAALALTFGSCNKNNDTPDPDDPDTPPSTEYYTTLGTKASEVVPGTYELGNGEQEYPFKGDVTLDASKKYLLRGWVYITEGSSIASSSSTASSHSLRL